MVLEKLGSSIKETLAKVARAVFVDEKLINELIKEVQKALLQSDVNVKLVFELTNKIKERALKEKLPSGLTKKEQLVNIVHEELVEFLGGKGSKIKVGESQFRIMLVGLFGNGKTTTAGKLAKFFSKRGHKIALVGLDVHRPAAMEQIEQIAKQAKVDVFLDKKEKNALKIWKKVEKDLKKYDVLIIDTAGRDALSKDLVEEIENLNKKIKANENFLVISADVGQAAQTQAQQFHDSCGVTGVVATKMDGTAKGGGALTACAATDAPIKFIGVGEKLDDLEEFDPVRFVGRMLGMGDIEALLEKAKDAISKEDAEDLGKKLLKGDFNLIDLYEQMSAMKKMGPMNKVMEMIPGFSQLKMPKEMLQVQEGKLEKWRHIMNSMTQKELEDPEVIDGKRVERIAKGSGTSVSAIRELIKQYRMSKKLMKKFKGKKGMKGMEQMMKNMPNFK
ncbi:signal recognition particle protein [Candidatus Woesearchaeota archaeon]|nr:signal recognition particle protein [Candidatus Woesearchaeota archaeon]